MGIDGKTTKSAATGDVTLTTNEAKKGSIRVTGYTLFPRTLTLPAPASAADTYVRVIHNALTSTMPLWQAPKSYNQGDLVEPSPRRFGIAFEKTSTGSQTTVVGSSQPTDFATVSVGQTVSDNGITWTCRKNEEVVHLTVQTSSKSRKVLIPPGTTSIVEVDENGVREVVGGFYDPRNFGAMFDGTTDDLSALQAMHDAMPWRGGRVMWPNSMCWISDTWKISKPIEIIGCGGNSRFHSGIECPPGKTAIYLEDKFVSADQNSAELAHIENLNIRSKTLVHGYYYGLTTGTGVMLGFEVGQPARKGDLVVALGGAHPTRCFRIVNTGQDNAAAIWSGSEPDWNTTLGDETKSGGITYVTEAFPSAHMTSTPYNVGDRVYLPNDNRFILKCEVAGTSAATRPVLLGGDGNGKTPKGNEIGSTVVDGGVTWRLELAAGFYVACSNVHIERCYLQGLSGAAVHIQGGNGQDIRGKTVADTVRITNLFFEFTGLGIYVAAEDSNGVVIDKPFGINLGQYQPRVDAADEDRNGGYLIHDHSLGGIYVHGAYAQRCSRTVLKTAPGRSTFVACFSEADQLSWCGGGAAITMGASNTFDRTSKGGDVLYLSPEGGYGLREIDTINTIPLWAKNTPYNEYDLVTPNPRRFGIAFEKISSGKQTSGGSQPAEFATATLSNNIDPAKDNIVTEQTESGDIITWRCVDATLKIDLTKLDQDGGAVFNTYAGHLPDWLRYQYVDGYFRRRFGPYALRDAYWLSVTRAGLNPGPGHFGFPDGFFLGDPTFDTPLYDGKLKAAYDVAIRQGVRKRGDRFRSGQTIIEYTADGYRGLPWSLTSTTLVVEDRQRNTPGSIVEPSTNIGLRAGGEQVWQCTTTGPKGSEPSPWPALPTPGVTTVTTGAGAVLTFLGYTPPYNVQQINVDKAPTAFRTIRASLINMDPDQVVDDGGVVDGVDLVLPDNATTRIAWDIEVGRKGTADGGSIELKVTYRRTGGGAPTLIGSATPTYNLTGTAINATTINAHESANRISLRCSPQIADATNPLILSIHRTQTECVD
jgi:hypothetical protein